MMKFFFLRYSTFYIRYSAVLCFLTSDLCPLKPKSALTPTYLTYRVGIGPPHHKAPG